MIIIMIKIKNQKNKNQINNNNMRKMYKNLLLLIQKIVLMMKIMR